MNLRGALVLAMAVGVAGWSCGGGAPTNCPAGRVSCAGVCCASGQVCNGGLCAAPCATALCGGVCCSSGQVCSGGVCTTSCATPLCGGVCCASGQICNGGTCQSPYQSAELVVYLCPDFSTGSCGPGYFTLDQTCRPIQSFTRGTCYHTGFTVAPNRSYGISSCVGCTTGCGNPTAFTTPSAGFSRPTYFPGDYFYCTTQCTPPSDCQ